MQTAADHIESYCAHLTQAGKCRASTVSAYRNDLRLFRDFCDSGNGGFPFLVGHPLLDNYVAHLYGLGKTDATVDRSLSSLRGFFSFLELCGIIEKSPLRGFFVIRYYNYGGKEIRKQVLRGMEGGGDPAAARDHAIMALLAAGMRVVDICELSFGNVDMRHGNMLIPSSGSLIKLEPGTVQMLCDYIKAYGIDMRTADKSSPVFVSIKNKRLTRQGIYHIIKKRARSLGIDADLTPKMLR